MKKLTRTERTKIAREVNDNIKGLLAAKGVSLEKEICGASNILSALGGKEKFFSYLYWSVGLSMTQIKQDLNFSYTYLSRVKKAAAEKIRSILDTKD